MNGFVLFNMVKTVAKDKNTKYKIVHQRKLRTKQHVPHLNFVTSERPGSVIKRSVNVLLYYKSTIIVNFSILVFRFCVCALSVCLFGFILTNCIFCFYSH